MFPLPLGLSRFVWERPSLIELHAASAHFPVALLLTAAFCDAASAVFKSSSLRATAFWTHLLGTAGAAVTVGLGWFGNPWRWGSDERAKPFTFTSGGAWRRWCFSRCSPGGGWRGATG